MSGEQDIRVTRRYMVKGLGAAAIGLGSGLMTSGPGCTCILRHECASSLSMITVANLHAYSGFCDVIDAAIEAWKNRDLLDKAISLTSATSENERLHVLAKMFVDAAKDEAMKKLLAKLGRKIKIARNLEKLKERFDGLLTSVITESETYKGLVKHKKVLAKLPAELEEALNSGKKEPVATAARKGVEALEYFYDKVEWLSKVEFANVTLCDVLDWAFGTEGAAAEAFQGVLDATAEDIDALANVAAECGDSLCGEPGHEPRGVDEADWVKYSCQLNTKSKSGCKRSDAYGKGRGCPGDSVRCCPAPDAG